MAKFKNQQGHFNLFYSDTDSIIIDKPLPNHLVGSELGLFKLEHKIQKAVFLAQKVYSLVTSDNESIIRVKGFSQNTKNIEGIHGPGTGLDLGVLALAARRGYLLKGLN